MNSNLRNNLKKVAVRALFVGSAGYALFAPFAAAASFFSLGSVLAGSAQVGQASSGTYNSQTVPVLAPAVNLDPSPSIGGGDITTEGGALLAQAGPEGTAADIANAPQSAAISVYTVHPGDTLQGIADMYGVKPSTIKWANDGLPNGIHPGDQLIILPIDGVQYTVKAGDTLASVAKRYNSDAGEIAQYNGLPDNAALNPGDSLLIPNGEVAAPAQPTKPSGSVRGKPAGAGSGKKAGAFEPFLGGSGPALPGYFSWPVAGGVITQGLHGWNAVDIGAPTGTSIYAAAAGTVIIAKQNGAYNGGYGNYVVIAHPNGTQTLYGHMSRVLVSSGQHVDQGDVIGKVGETGWATGPHLHFEVRGAANPFAN